jgi:hypothetical protein
MRGDVNFTTGFIRAIFGFTAGHIARHQQAIGRTLQVKQSLKIFSFALIIMPWAQGALATNLVGRVVDVAQAQVIAGAQIKARNNLIKAYTAHTDALGYFRLPGLHQGAYILEIELPDGRHFVSRIVLAQQRATQFIELDYSRSHPSDEDGDY